MLLAIKRRVDLDREAGRYILTGAHLENIVATDLLAWSVAAKGRPGILHWRTSAGAEVDFVIELAGRLLPVEVKATKRVQPRDARHLRAFLAEYRDLAGGALLLYGGSETLWLDRDVLATPWHRVL